MSFRTVLRSGLAMLAVLSCSSAAHAQLFRAYLASDGSDANACTLLAPCRLLPAALAAVANGGEIWMLDSANYNGATVVVGKSVSILAVPGAVGSVVASGGPAISITASGLKVSLQNLVIVPLPASGATHGVSVSGASSVTIAGSVIANLPSHGVYVSGPGTLRLANTIIRDCGQRGVLVENGASAEVSGAHLLGNGQGGLMAMGTNATATRAGISDSVVSGTTGSAGIWALGDGTGSFARVSVTRSTIEGHSFAIGSEAFDGATSSLTISYSMVANNNYKWYALGTIRSLGNNHFVDNANSFGSLTQIPPE